MNMTPKQRVLQMVQRQDDDVAIDHVVYNISLMLNIAIAEKQIERGEFIDHDDLVRQLEQEWREIESSGANARKPAEKKSARGSAKTRHAGPSHSKNAS